MQNFPFIEQDFDALTDYELLCKVVEYLNKVINSQNEVLQDVSDFEENVTENFEALRDKFVELKSYVDNYFANLDVQEEINNKLDEMADNGTLADIISQYLNSIAVFGFDNVAGMKTATNLIAGSYARTMGYYVKNDFGGGLYRIRNVTNDDIIDEGSIISLDGDDLVAELIVEHGDVIVNQFGAKGDNTTDDSTAIQNAINYSSTIGLNSILLVSKNYYCESGIVVNNSDFRIHGNPACEYTPALRFDDDVPVGVDVKNYGFRMDNIVIKATNIESANGSIIGVRLLRSIGSGTSTEIENAMNLDADITNCEFFWLHQAILAKGRNVNIITCGFGECENGFKLDILGTGHSHRDIWIRDSRFHNIGANKRDTTADFQYGVAIAFPDTWVRTDVYGNIIRNNFFDYCNNVFTGCILGCTIADNNILDCLHNAIVAVNPNSGAMTSNNNIEVMISNNNINIRGDASNYGIYLKGVSRPRIVGNVIANQPTIAVLLDTCGTIWFVDNSLNCIRTDITENLKIIGATGDEVFLQGNMFSRFNNANNTFVNISGVTKVYTGGNLSNGGSTAIVCNVTPLKQGEDPHFW